MHSVGALIFLPLTASPPHRLHTVIIILPCLTPSQSSSHSLGVLALFLQQVLSPPFLPRPYPPHTQHAVLVSPMQVPLFLSSPHTARGPRLARAGPPVSVLSTHSMRSSSPPCRSPCSCPLHIQHAVLVSPMQVPLFLSSPHTARGPRLPRAGPPVPVLSTYSTQSSSPPCRSPCSCPLHIQHAVLVSPMQVPLFLSSPHTACGPRLPHAGPPVPVLSTYSMRSSSRPCRSPCFCPLHTQHAVLVSPMQVPLFLSSPHTARGPRLPHAGPPVPVLSTYSMRSLSPPCRSPCSCPLHIQHAVLVSPMQVPLFLSSPHTARSPRLTRAGPPVSVLSTHSTRSSSPPCRSPCSCPLHIQQAVLVSPMQVPLFLSSPHTARGPRLPRAGLSPYSCPLHIQPTVPLSWMWLCNRPPLVLSVLSMYRPRSLYDAAWIIT